MRVLTDSSGLVRLVLCVFVMLESLVQALAVDASDTDNDPRTYDYIVVGGGTAGIALATRLTQRAFSVALVEAGGYYQSLSLAAIPGSDLLRVGSRPHIRSLIDWGFVTRPEPGANMRYIHYARGRCLGGSPTRDSMAEWAASVNDSSYTWDRVLPYFKRTVHFTPPNILTRFPNATPSYDPRAYEPSGGPLEVSFANYAMSFSTWMRLGMNAIGIEDIQDFNAGSLIGTQYCTVTVRPPDETRSSSQTSFLGKAKPPSMEIYLYTLAQKILFDDKKRAIGPADTLKDHGIPVLADRPGVGQNMWDHPFFGPSFRVEVATFTDFVNDPWFFFQQVIKWFFLGRGMGTSPGADYLAWEKIPDSLRSGFSNKTLTDLRQFPSDWPEAEYMSGPGYLGSFSDPVIDQPKDGYRYASMLAVLVAPTSRGNITIRSADMDHAPIISPNWLDSESDQEVAIAMFKRIREAATSAAMAPVMVGPEYDPGRRVATDDDILEYIRNSLMTIWHPACTCKMGRPDDPLAVVDSQARVYGVEGLRVVDASAFPILPPGHPQSTVCELIDHSY
ncbi:hypothetical protein N8T08_005229 [Aspergillus melleus]|uniref:Uncharacterized protein n=1 Tax=Aspergillus melleus TaxID=138277 RepID=A0ACC3BGC9_9EURO|nr:hypothetical protein N8T08_005229 [Aspergillus melleus]